MKSTALFALFLLSAFTSYLPSTTAQPVIDIDGELVPNGGTYYILPLIRGKGGGIERVATGNETCPLTVVQSRNELSKGLPIIFSSPFLSAYIFEDVRLNIQFTFTISSKWTIVEGLPEGPAVKLTGYEKTVPGWFKIEKANSLYLNVYKLSFTALDGSISGDIAIYIDANGIRRLVMTENDPLVVQFQKVGSSTA